MIEALEVTELAREREGWCAVGTRSLVFHQQSVGWLRSSLRFEVSIYSGYTSKVPAGHMSERDDISLFGNSYAMDESGCGQARALRLLLIDLEAP